MDIPDRAPPGTAIQLTDEKKIFAVTDRPVKATEIFLFARWRRIFTALPGQRPARFIPAAL